MAGSTYKKSLLTEEGGVVSNPYPLKIKVIISLRNVLKLKTKQKVSANSYESGGYGLSRFSR